MVKLIVDNFDGTYNLVTLDHTKTMTIDNEDLFNHVSTIKELHTLYYTGKVYVNQDVDESFDDCSGDVCIF